MDTRNLFTSTTLQGIPHIQEIPNEDNNKFFGRNHRHDPSLTKFTANKEAFYNRKSHTNTRCIPVVMDLAPLDIPKFPAFYECVNGQEIARVAPVVVHRAQLACLWNRDKKGKFGFPFDCMWGRYSNWSQNWSLLDQCMAFLAKYFWIVGTVGTDPTVYIGNCILISCPLSLLWF